MTRTRISPSKRAKKLFVFVEILLFYLLISESVNNMYESFIMQNSNINEILLTSEKITIGMIILTICFLYLTKFVLRKIFDAGEENIINFCIIVNCAMAGFYELESSTNILFMFEFCIMIVSLGNMCYYTLHMTNNNHIKFCFLCMCSFVLGNLFKSHILKYNENETIHFIMLGYLLSFFTGLNIFLFLEMF